MRRLTPLFVLACLTLTLVGQDRAFHEAKMKAPFVERLPWVFSLDEAIAKAKKDDRYILLYATRSYGPYPPAKFWETGVLMSDWWQFESQAFVPLLHLVSRLPDTPDPKLLETYGITTVPYFAFLDETGRMVSTFNPETDDEYRAEVAYARLHQLKRRSPDDPEVHALWLMASLDRTPSAEVEAQLEEAMKSGSPSEKLVARYERFKQRYAVRGLAYQYREELKAARFKGAAAIKEVEDRMSTLAYQRYAAGAKPALRDLPGFNYMRLAFEGAMTARDAKNAQLALNWIEVYGGPERHLRKMIGSLRERLDALWREQRK